MGYVSLVEEIEALRARGYAADFSVTRDGQLHCHPCGHTLDPRQAVVETTTRFEGASNPDDQAVLFGIHCGECDLRGVLVAAYGPTATAEEADVLTALSSPPA